MSGGQLSNTPTVHRIERLIGGRPFIIENGKLARNAGGAVTVRHGDTMVLVSACMANDPRTGIDFLPLTVEFEERLYAAGKIPGGFIKREGRPTMDATLAARITDRTIRPLFNKHLHHEVQVIITVLSSDRDNDADVLGMCGASAAIGLAGLPFEGPVAAVRVGLIGGQFTTNPTYTDLQESLLDLIVSGTKDAIVMVEAGAKQVPEHTMVEALRYAHQEIQTILGMQEELFRLAPAKPKVELPHIEMDPALRSSIASHLQQDVASTYLALSKSEREEGLGSYIKESAAKLAEHYSAEDVGEVFHDEIKAEMRRKILDEGIRTDGRKTAEVRPIWCEVGLLPRTHGSGLFTRGATQILSVVTLGTPGEQQKLDGISPEEHKRFMHHYNFPPYSVGEVRRTGSPGRREIGHGALAERALAEVVPDVEDFPYTMRIVSETLMSNGSSSMGSICGSILAMMDAGVPIKAPVAGVAMGLITGEGGRFAVLTDIAGLEDHMGDMDFKVAGTREGITALQMDIKIKGITFEVLEQALAQAKEGRLHILGKMLETLDTTRTELSQFAPRLTTLTIDPEKIRFLIGPGGKTIRSIIDECKVTVDVENDGTVIVGSTNGEQAEKAIRMIEALTKDVEVGGIYTGKVTRTMNFGAFVEILPGKEGLVHISELADYRVPSVEEVVQIGDEIMVMVTEIDRMGRINLSRRALMVAEGDGGGGEGGGDGGEGAPASSAPSGGGYGGGGGGYGGPRRDGGGRGSPGGPGGRNGRPSGPPRR